MEKTKRRTFITQCGMAVGLGTIQGSGLLVAPQASAEVASAAVVQSVTLAPERILLTWDENPARSQAFTWRSAATATSPKIQIAPWSANPKFAAKARTIDATCQVVDLDEGRKASECKVRVADLTPNTQYSYRVGDDKMWSEWFRFRTASEKPDAFRFIYLGDVQNDIRSMCPRTIRAAYAQAPDARFLVHAGDLITEGYDDGLWGEWCYAMGWMGATIPHVPTPGNHDMHRAPSEPNPNKVFTVSPEWRHRFVLPENGPQGVDCLRQEAYYIDYQGLRIISLDSNVYANDDFEPEKKTEIAAKQTAWLETVLADNPNRWTIIMHHHPIYSIGKDRDNTALRETLLPIYDKYHVDLVLQGHDHHYGRTHKLASGKIVEPGQPGTIYAVSVAGPKMYPKNPKFENLMAVVQSDMQMYQVIEVKEDRLAFNAYAVTGERIDAFEIKKSAKDQPSVLSNPVLPAAEGSLSPQ